MAEASGGQKPAIQSYGMLGGVNQKASEYSTGLAQFLNLRNLDFDVPNALSKRPGSTQAITANTSGPLNSVFEFQRLDGASYVVTGSDTAMFYRAGAAGLTLLSSGWNNGQPADMLTFVNRLWMANGQKYEAWSGVGSTSLPAGAYCPMFNDLTAIVGAPFTTTPITGSSFFISDFKFQSWIGGFGATLALAKVGLFVTYSYIYADGRYGPLDIRAAAKNLAQFYAPSSSSPQLLDNFIVSGITVPANSGITALALWVAFDAFAYGGGSQVAGYSNGLAGFSLQTTSFPFREAGVADITMSPGVSDSTIYDNFRLYTVTPAASWGGTFILNFAGSSGRFITWVNFYASTEQFNYGASLFAPGRPLSAFSLGTFCWFNTNTPKYLDINQNVMFMSGFSQAPSRIDFSEVGDPLTIDPEYNIEVRTNDGDVIRGHKTYNNQTIVFKENSFHKIIGVSPEEFELIELSTEYGCISDKTIIEYQEKLLFLDKKGIVEYNGASWDIISTPVEDIFRAMNLSAAREKACAVHQLYRNQVWFGIPINGATQNNVTVVYDYLVKAWTFFDGFNPASFAMVQGDLSKPTVWMGNYSGVLRYFSESFYGDNGQGITCLAYSAWEHGQQNETWIWRRLFLDVATASGVTGTITGKLFSNYNTGTVQATFSMFQDAFQSRAEFGLPGKACAFEIAHNSASLPLLINGYTWARRFIRNV